MEKRLKNYLSYISEQLQRTLSPDDKKALKENILTQISFFQHERLIHLIVTVTFALLAIMTLICVYMSNNILLEILLILILGLLFLYVRHYFMLERGVQKLYEYYDRLNSS
jgi:hypothetical protein